MWKVSKALSDITQNLVKTFKKACDVATDPNHTQSDIDQVWRDFENACKDAGDTSTDAAYAEVKDHVTQQMQDGGMSKAEAEKWFEHKWKDVIDLGEKVRKNARNVKPAAKFLWLKVLGAIVAGGFFFYYLRHEPPSESTIRMHNNIWDENRIAEQMQLLKTSEDQFNMIMSGLQASAPRSLPPMPVDVAAEAETPVEVEVTTPSGTTQSYRTNIGRVYSTVPHEAQHGIEQAFKIDHDHDHPTVNHHRDQEFHKEFTVDSPVGSAHFKY